MKIQRILISTLLIIGVFLVFARSCEKEHVPVVRTLAVSNITSYTATSGGDIPNEGSSTVLYHGVCWSTDSTPTISDNKTIFEGRGGSFISNILGLNGATAYYVRAYATNSVGTGYGMALGFTTKEDKKGTFTDARDSTIYQTVTIGNQIWMAENLRYLPSVTYPFTDSQSMPYYYVYGYYGNAVADAKITANYASYGVLYNWAAAKVSCPAGWHLPSDAEWTTLTNYLGRSAGEKLKAITHWKSPNYYATNQTGFTALPGGYRHTNSNFIAIGYYGSWWSATEYKTNRAWFRRMEHDHDGVSRLYDGYYELGFSVRCVRD